jgi:hypothetical protein
MGASVSWEAVMESRSLFVAARVTVGMAAVLLLAGFCLAASIPFDPRPSSGPMLPCLLFSGVVFAFMSAIVYRTARALKAHEERIRHLEEQLAARR